MIQAKEVHRRAVIARAKVETEHAAKVAIAYAGVAKAVAPSVNYTLVNIEKVITAAMNEGAYGVEYPITHPANLKNAYYSPYRVELVKLLEDAGFTANIIDSLPRLLVITWSDYGRPA